ncbi:E3 ubiquitin-protein ligase TM129 [Papilio machaon]|uniref:E3 ubiquitin-protein ligase TM129 n=1 Tax=Papilio machaon TaxID=76193 RepID=UPI001E6660AC|nr:E3 ubiquitin-protein ligase TM129 [Papilio machaon]
MSFAMDILLTLFYLLFSFCVIYPPTEFVAAGFTIPQIFEGFLGSENMNFIGYHMKRITITAFFHSCLPLGYVFTLWCGGERGSWMMPSAISTVIIVLLMCYKLVCWWEYEKLKHPVVRPLLCYVPQGCDWRVVANNINIAFRSVDKVCLPLTATSKLVATDTWLIRVTQYGMNAVQHGDCSLFATATDNHTLTPTGEEEVQYVNIEVIPYRPDVEPFSFRVTTTALRELQPRLPRPVRVPDHISLLPTVVERFVTLFKHYVDQNPTYYVDQELEQCIGCMQNMADVKLDRRCEPVPAPLAGIAPPPCQQCNCRVLWCCSCMARWWAARAGAALGAGTPSSAWLAARGSCPVCRAVFCMLDVLPARQRDS